MTTSEIIASLALVVALASFAVAYLSFRRTSKQDEPNAWVELEPLTQENCWTASIHLKNPTRYPLKVQAVSVPLSRVPVDDKQGFLLAATEEALKLIRAEDLPEALRSGDPGRFVKMSVEDVTVDSGSESVMQVMLQRGRLSTAAEAAITLHYWMILETPRFRTLTVRARLPSAGIRLQLQRV
jgi:hypothetical protein